MVLRELKLIRTLARAATDMSAVITAVVMISSIFWNISPRSALKVTQHPEEHADSFFRVGE
jgi:hypothetical protein